MSDVAIAATSPSARSGPKATARPDRHRTLGFEVIDWMESCLVHTEGEWRGQPFRLLPWQKRLLLELFVLVPDDETQPEPGQEPSFRHGLRRRYRQAFITIPKKNGKTELAAAIALYLLIGDGEPSPKGVFVAGSLKQAGLSFRATQTMILESPVLSQLVGQRNVGDLVIEVPSIPGSRMERVAAEAGTNDGPSLHFGVLDEVHEYPGEEGKKVHGVITNAGAARKNPMFVSISTVGADPDDDEQVWVDLYRRGLAVERRPDADPTFFFYRVQASPDSDWQDRAVWEAANPSANETVSWSFYQSEWAKGERWCRRYYLNDPPGGVEDPWMDMEAWSACQGSPALHEDEPAFVCVRIGHHHRAAAVATAQRRGERVSLFTWTLEAPDGAYVDAEAIERHVVARRQYGAPVVAEVTNRRGTIRKRRRPGPLLLHHEAFFEPSRQRLERDGMATLGVPSSPEKLTPAAETLMQLVTAGTLVHDGNADTAVQMSRLVAKQRPRGWAIESGNGEPIVAAQAAMLAVHWAMASDRPKSRSGEAGF